MIYICQCIVSWFVQSPLAISIHQPRCLGACCRRLHFPSVTCSSRFSVTPILEDHTLPQVQMLRPGLKKQSSGSSGSRDMSSHEFARRLGWFRHRFRIVSDNHRLRLSLSRLWMICRIVSSSGLWSLMSNHNDMLWYTMAIPVLQIAIAKYDDNIRYAIGIRELNQKDAAWWQNILIRWWCWWALLNPKRHEITTGISTNRSGYCKLNHI